MSESSPENEVERSGEASDLESREIEFALPDWLADEFQDGDAIIPNVPQRPVVEDVDDNEESTDYPAVATVWIDPAATRILTERAALLALVASQTRGAGWGAEPPLLAPIQPPVTLESLDLDNDDSAISNEVEDHVPWPLLVAGLAIIAVVVAAGILIWYFEVL